MATDPTMICWREIEKGQDSVAEWVPQDVPSTFKSVGNPGRRVAKAWLAPDWTRKRAGTNKGPAGALVWPAAKRSAVGGRTSHREDNTNGCLRKVAVEIF